MKYLSRLNPLRDANTYEFAESPKAYIPSKEDLHILLPYLLVEAKNSKE